MADQQTMMSHTDKIIMHYGTCLQQSKVLKEVMSDWRPLLSLVSHCCLSECPVCLGFAASFSMDSVQTTLGTLFHARTLFSYWTPLVILSD